MTETRTPRETKLHHYAFVLHCGQGGETKELGVYTISAFNLISAMVTLLHQCEEHLEDISDITIMRDIHDDNGFRIAGPLPAQED